MIVSCLIVAYKILPNYSGFQSVPSFPSISRMEQHFLLLGLLLIAMVSSSDQQQFFGPNACTCPPSKCQYLDLWKKFNAFSIFTKDCSCVVENGRGICCIVGSNGRCRAPCKTKLQDIKFVFNEDEDVMK